MRYLKNILVVLCAWTLKALYYGFWAVGIIICIGVALCGGGRRR